MSGGSARLNVSALAQCAVADMGAGMTPPPSGVDTVVAAAADARAANDDVVIVTGDDEDFQMLGSLATNAARLAVLVV